MVASTKLVKEERTRGRKELDTIGWSIGQQINMESGPCLCNRLSLSLTREKVDDLPLSCNLYIIITFCKHLTLGASWG